MDTKRNFTMTETADLEVYALTLGQKTLWVDEDYADNNMHADDQTPGDRLYAIDTDEYVVVRADGTPPMYFDSLYAAACWMTDDEDKHCTSQPVFK